MLQSNEKIIKHKVGLLNLAEELGNVSKWTCPAKVPDTYLIYTATVSNARGLFPPSVECLRRGL